MLLKPQSLGFMCLSFIYGQKDFYNFLRYTLSGYITFILRRNIYLNVQVHEHLNCARMATEERKAFLSPSATTGPGLLIMIVHSFI